MSKPTLSEWYAQQYLGAVGLDSAEGGRQFKQLVNTFPATDASGFVQFSGRGRMRAFMELRMTYPVGRGGYTCLAVTATLAGHTTHVAYVYWRRAAAAGATKTKPKGTWLSSTASGTQPAFCAAAKTIAKCWLWPISTT